MGTNGLSNVTVCDCCDCASPASFARCLGWVGQLELCCYCRPGRQSAKLPDTGWCWWSFAECLASMLLLNKHLNNYRKSALRSVCPAGLHMGGGQSSVPLEQSRRKLNLNNDFWFNHSCELFVSL